MPVEIIEALIDKTCSACREALPADAEFFFRDKRSADGLRSVCKACYHDLPSVLSRRKELKP